MRKLVQESLVEFTTSQMMFEKSFEKNNSKAVKVDQSKKDKYNQAIDALKQQLKDAKKPGAYKSTMEKNVKIKEFEDKIAAFEDKIDKLNENLNEGSVEHNIKVAKAVLADPEKYKSNFVSLFSNQTNKQGGDKLKKYLLEIDLETRKRLAQEVITFFEKNPKATYPTLVKDNIKKMFVVKGLNAAGESSNPMGK